MVRTRHASLFDRVLPFDEVARTATGSVPGPSEQVGWASNAWLTADGVVVLNSGSTVGSGLRRRRISSLTADGLSQDVPRLSDVLATEGVGRLLLLAKSDELLDAIVATAASHSSGDGGPRAASKLWIAGTNIESLARQRTRTTAQLVDWTTKAAASNGLERRMATLHSYGINVLAMPHKDWSAGSVALCHRFDVMAYGWGCEYEREMAALIDNGIDAIQTPHTDRLSAVLNEYL